MPDPAPAPSPIPTNSPATRRALLHSVVLCVALIVASDGLVQASSVITHGSRQRGWVALTFDDGWSLKRCGQIVRTLRRKRAPATFFINGTYMKRAPGRWRRILDGFPVANHTLSHPWLTLLGEAAIRQQIVSNERAIERMLRRSMLHLLRPPFGAYDSRVLGVADAIGYRTVLWDTDGLDTMAGATTSSVIRYATGGGNGAIVLLHCGPAVTPGAVGPIIDSYRRRGYRLVDLGQMLGLRPAPKRRPPDACRVRNVDKGIRRSSLRRAVAAASPGDRLTVQGTCRGTTTIDRDIRIRGISSARSGPPTLRGAPTGSVLAISPEVVVSVRDLTIRDGTARRGGGIANRGRLTLVDAIVHENTARIAGGGIFNAASGSLTLTGSSSVQENRGTRGGGIANHGTLEIRRTSSVRRNRASGEGGGVRNTGVLVMAASSRIAANSTDSLGGGLYSEGTLDGVICAPAGGANVRRNRPDDCQPPVVPGP